MALTTCLGPVSRVPSRVLGVRHPVCFPGGHPLHCAAGSTLPDSSHLPPPTVATWHRPGGGGGQAWEAGALGPMFPGSESRSQKR